MQALQMAKEAGEKTLHSIRQARGAQQKVLRAMELAATARPDDLRKAKDKMEKVVDAQKKALEG
jgi:ribosome recycling factor